MVVIGGSFSGLATLRHLKKHANVTLVEAKDYFEYTPGVLHLLTGSNAANALIVPIEEVSQGSEHVRGFFEGVKPANKVVLVRALDGVTQKQIDYDVLVICTGQSCTHPVGPSRGSLDKRLRLEEVRKFNEKLNVAGKVVMIGGGLVGVEMAAEIIHRCRTKNVPKVTLISKSKLLSALPKKAGRYAHSWLTRQGVEIILEDTLTSIPYSPIASNAKEKLRSTNLRTVNGKTIDGVELIIDCSNSGVGPFWNTQDDIYKVGNNVFPDDITTDIESVIWPYNNAGFIEVNEYLQATWDNTIFAAGDVTELMSGVGLAASTLNSGPYGKKSSKPAVRNAHIAESQAEVVATNIKVLLNMKLTNCSPSCTMAKYPKDIFYGAQNVPLVACVSLGPNNGIIVFNELVLGGALFGVFGGFLKFAIERSKIAEIKQRKWGRAMWAFSHVVLNSVHSFWDKSRGFFGKYRVLRRSVLSTTLVFMITVFLRARFSGNQWISKYF